MHRLSIGAQGGFRFADTTVEVYKPFCLIRAPLHSASPPRMAGMHLRKQGVRQTSERTPAPVHCPFSRQLPGAAGPHRCRTIAVASAASSPHVPFGGAFVTKLEGSTKIVKGRDAHIVPLHFTTPDSAQSALPFGASLECTRSCQSLTPSAQSFAREMLDVLYILQGSGQVTSDDGVVRQLHAGDSLVTWHNTTQLRSLSSDQLVALKFHFPASVLLTPEALAQLSSSTTTQPRSLAVGHTPQPLSHSELQVLVDEYSGHSDGELSADEAAEMLRHVQHRAALAMARLYQSSGTTPDAADSSSNNTTGSSGAFAGTEAHKRWAGVGHAGGPLRLGLVLGGALHGVGQAARAVGLGAGVGVGLLRQALRRAGRGREGGGSGSLAAMGHDGSVPATHVAEGAGGGARAAGAGGAAAPAPSLSSCVLLQRALEEFQAFRFPRQTNKLAFVFDPAELGLSLSFGVEVFEPGHHTPLHIHKTAHELFFVLAGEGVAFCNGQRFTVRAGDCVVFPPRAIHGIDNKTDSKLYCLQLMTPNEAFVEHVKSGEAVGRLDDEDLCNLAARHC